MAISLGSLSSFCSNLLWLDRQRSCIKQHRLSVAAFGMGTLAAPLPSHIKCLYATASSGLMWRPRERIPSSVMCPVLSTRGMDSQRGSYQQCLEQVLFFIRTLAYTHTVTYMYIYIYTYSHIHTYQEPVRQEVLLALAPVVHPSPRAPDRSLLKDRKTCGGVPVTICVTASARAAPAKEKRNRFSLKMPTGGCSGGRGPGEPRVGAQFCKSRIESQAFGLIARSDVTRISALFMQDPGPGWFIVVVVCGTICY